VRAAAVRAADWLFDVEMVNDDGRWGAGDLDTMLCTAEVVRALRATNLLGPHYVGGVAWLANHRAPNHDLAVRRLAALTPHRDSLQTDRATIIGAKTTGLTAPGWGLTGFYRFDPLDTALVLHTLGAGDAAFFSAHADAIQSLAQSGLTIGYASGTADITTAIAAARAVRTCAATGIAPCGQLLGSLVPAIETNLVGYTPASSLERALIAGGNEPSSIVATTPAAGCAASSGA